MSGETPMDTLMKACHCLHLEVADSIAFDVQDKARAVKTELDHLRQDNERLRGEVAHLSVLLANQDATAGKLRGELAREIHASHSLQFSLDEIKALCDKQGPMIITLESDLQRHKSSLEAHNKALVEAREALEKVGFFCAGEGKFDYVTKHVEKTLATINSLLGDKCGVATPPPDNQKGGS